MQGRPGGMAPMQGRPGLQPGGFDEKFAVLAHTFEVASGATKVRPQGFAALNPIPMRGLITKALKHDP